MPTLRRQCRTGRSVVTIASGKIIVRVQAETLYRLK